MIDLSYITAVMYMNLSALSINLVVLGECDRQIQLRMQQEKKKDDPRWKLLARKVASAKVISSLSLPKRKRDEDIKLTINNPPEIRTFELQ